MLHIQKYYLAISIVTAMIVTLVLTRVVMIHFMQ
jgi:hypothetical protein